MATTVAVSIRGKITGLPESGSQLFNLRMTNSSGVGTESQTTATTAVGSAVSITIPTSAKYLIIDPPSTNTAPMRLTGSTLENGFPISSADPTFISVAATAYFLYTTNSTTIPGIRVVIF